MISIENKKENKNKTKRNTKTNVLGLGLGVLVVGHWCRLRRSYPRSVPLRGLSFLPLTGILTGDCWTFTDAGRSRVAAGASDVEAGYSGGGGSESESGWISGS